MKTYLQHVGAVWNLLEWPFCIVMALIASFVIGPPCLFLGFLTLVYERVRGER